MKTINNERDSLTLYVKRTLANEIVEYYNILGWELDEERDNKRYEDIVDLVFSRPHKIENKDELQLFQVYMEERINKLAKLGKYKHTLTTSLGLCFGVIGLALIAFGLLISLNVLHILNLIFGICFASAGLIIVVTGSCIIPRIFKKENEKYSTERAIIESELKAICQKASTLQGGTNEPAK